MRIPMFDPLAQRARIGERIDRRVLEVTASGAYIGGDVVAGLERELEQHFEYEHVVTCANGTDALQLAIEALVPPGHAIIVPAFTFVATAEAVVRAGYVPVFAAVDPETYVMTEASCTEALIYALNRGQSVAGVIGVELFGRPADGVAAFAQTHRLVHIIDAAQSMGARREHPGDALCTSFFPSKPLGCYGDGGAVMLHTQRAAERVRCIATHGADREHGKYRSVEVGMNSRLDAIQAAVLRVKLEAFSWELEQRHRIWNEYRENLEWAMAVPDQLGTAASVLTLQHARRDEIVDCLRKAGIGSAVYYPEHVSNMAPYARSLCVPDLEPITRYVFSVPCHADMTSEEVHEVCAVIVEAIDYAVA